MLQPHERIARHSLTRNSLALAILITLGGCIPASIDTSARRAPAQQPAAPRLPTDLVALIEHGPVWEARKVAENAQTVAESIYIVQPGDTLRGVGNRTGAGSEILAMANALEAPYIIRPGQKLRVPAVSWAIYSPPPSAVTRRSRCCLLPPKRARSDLDRDTPPRRLF